MSRKRQGKATLWTLAFLLAAATASVLVIKRKSPGLSGKEFGGAPEIYGKQCAPCHGAEGFGDGKAAYLLRPRPRDFSQGKFLLVSTDNRVPTDEDLFRTISRGMPGSAMPPWGHLPENDRRALVRYIRTLAFEGKVKRLMGFTEKLEAGKPLSRKAAEEVAGYQLEVGKSLELPPEAPVSQPILEQGRKVYVATCAKCHGREGRGDGPENMEDDLGFRAFPRDFTKGVFKGSPEAKELAYRIRGGMPGSAMPTSEFRGSEDLWAVVHYVRSLIQPGAQERVAQRRQTIVARRASELPGDPLAPGWDSLPATYIVLMPLWWRDERIEGVDVRAAHDGETLAIQITWKDATANQEQAHVTTFGDAAALQFSSLADPPFFGMGDAAAAVNIWLWKAAWEQDLITRNGPAPTHPRAMMDFDISVKQPGPGVAAHVPSKAEDRDPTFYAGWGAGNLISNPHRQTAVEDLNAKGFGTLQAKGLPAQVVRGRGTWKDGIWRVVFVRRLTPSATGDVRFQPGRSVRIGFGVWDGEQGDRNGQKSVTIWHDLALAP